MVKEKKYVTLTANKKEANNLMNLWGRKKFDSKFRNVFFIRIYYEKLKEDKTQPTKEHKK